MKRLLKSAAGIALGLGLFASTQSANAQIYNEFTSPYRVNASYQALTFQATGYSQFKANDFKKLETVNGVVTNVSDRDKGYIEVNLPFDFEFAGKIYTKVYISVNGFITFEPIPALSLENTEVPSTLFNYDNFKSMIAPFWGDHMMRDVADYPQEDGIPGFTSSLVKVLSTNNMFVVEWNNLNINTFPNALPSSIANFQIRLYPAVDPSVSKQGDVEFCYGSIGTGTGFSVQAGAVVGMKGRLKGNFNNESDFLNGLQFDLLNNESPKAEKNVTITWPPSLHTDKRIRFSAIQKWTGYSSNWGDGDADCSRHPGGRHEADKDNQRRFVNTNDIRTIMRSMATGIKLDSNYKQAAYHADVNHNGRFFYTPDPVKYGFGSTEDPTFAKLIRFDYAKKSALYNTIDPEFYVLIDNNPERIYFQATELDASLIARFLAGKEVSLPCWNNQITGKTNASENATDFYFGTAVKISENIFEVPVYLNGSTNEAVAFKFDVNGTINNVRSTSNSLIFSTNDNKLVVAEPNPSEGPICYIEVSTESNELSANNVVYNDESRNAKSLKLGAEDMNSSMSVYPNPVSSNSVLSVNVPVNGNYEVNVFDILGNKVATFGKASYNAGLVNIPMNLDLNSGVYFLRMNGEGVSQSVRIEVSK